VTILFIGVNQHKVNGPHCGSVDTRTQTIV
jgi:hypothetical protein